jgi:aryl-alcohol dehydrogenase-like predicted oxidoreductase
MLQARLATGLPDIIGQILTGLQTDAQRAIQFTRSAPGLTTSLIGMSQLAHVEENLAVAKLNPATQQEFLRLFTQ